MVGKYFCCLFCCMDGDTASAIQITKEYHKLAVLPYLGVLGLNLHTALKQ